MGPCLSADLGPFAHIDLDTQIEKLCTVELTALNDLYEYCKLPEID